MVYDALGAHSRGDLGIFATLTTRPIRAALASAASFAMKAAMPLLVTAIASEASLIPLVFGTSLVFLVLLCGLATCGRRAYNGPRNACLLLSTASSLFRLVVSAAC
jgi:VIT1/CCC1 family predicted Fe2+/Mn2+ transporter